METTTSVMTSALQNLETKRESRAQDFNKLPIKFIKANQIRIKAHRIREHLVKLKTKI